MPDNVLIYIFFSGVLMTAIWRFAGFLISSGVSEDGPVIVWVQAVSTALVAGLLSRIIVFPPGALAEIALPLRLGAFAVGVAVFYLARRHLGLGVLAGVGTLVAIASLGTQSIIG